LTPIAENIGLFQVRFWDGKQWTDQWTEEMRSLPQCFEVTLATLPPQKGDPIIETFVVTFPRLSQAAAAAGAQQGAAVEGGQGQQGSGTSATTESASGSADQQGSPASSVGGKR
jgi:hypothetical protein